MRPGRRPVAHQDRLARPAAGRRAADLHAHGRATPGPRDATGVTLTDTLPAGVTFESATPSQGSCSEASGTVDLRAGHASPTAQSASVEIKVRPQVAGTITNEATSPPTRSTRRLGQLRERRDHRRSGRRPLGDEDGLARPGACGRAAHLHPHGAELRTLERHQVTLSDTLPAGVTFESATPIAGHLLRDSGHGHVRSRHHRQRPERERGRSRSGRRAGYLTNQRERARRP